MDLIVKIIEIKGKCPIYKLNDSFIIEDGYRLKSNKSLCMHSLASLMPWYNALRFIEPKKLGLGGGADQKKAYFQCSDPVDYTEGGTVVFEVSRKEN